ncbi:UvrD-helicase domain-containing protein [Staphylospora marina]|uniref:UvrD-helicase domain-containing protein n=1 Tax=Staphylospora marina TaxID=2490858 RepID=UPI0013DDB5D8|nr:UvrD-helicase domain-containing protein [Staphylospora marina]
MIKVAELTSEQWQAANCLDKNCIVQAGAGSGKTRVLVERYLAILERHNQDPGMLDRIVAITFTEKAAAEMKERIRKEVSVRARRMRQAGDDVRAAAWHRLFGEMERARITTIHSFCLQLLRRYPVEAGIDPDPVVLEEAESGRRLTESVEEALAARLSATGESTGVLESWVVDIGWSGSVNRLTGVLAELLTKGMDVPALREKTMSDLDMRERLSSDRAEREGSVRVPEPTEDAFGKREFPAARLERILLEEIFDVIEAAFRLYAERKQADGAIDYDEMQSRVCGLLEKHPEIRREIREGIDWLMVDEYQDTSPLQKKLIDLLGRDDDGSFRPGKLFVVGDPNQSIYGFRGVDVTVFHRTREEICASPEGTEVFLRHNFRSEPELVKLCNNVFGKLMNEEAPNGYVPAEAGIRGSSPSHVAEWIDVPKADPRFPGWDHRDLEAAMLARRIDRMIREEGVRPGQMAVLFRAMTHVKKVERELARLGIPYFVVKGRGFYDRQEIHDVKHFLRLLVNPEDRAAMVGVLRSPFCAVSDETVTRIALEAAWREGPERWAERPDLDEAERRKLRRFAVLLQKAGQLAGTMRIGDLLRMVLEESGYTVTAWAVPEGKRTVANLNKLLEQADRLEGMDGWSISRYLDRLEWLTREQERENEAAVESEDSDCVKLMTIHQAKGLEFPVVFVPDLSRKPGRNRLDLFVCDERGLVVNLKDGQGNTVERFTSAEERRKRLEREESLRLLYVAMTRAESRLVLSGVRGGTKKGGKEETWIEGLSASLGADNINPDTGEWMYEEGALPIRWLTGPAPDVSAGSRQETPLDRLAKGEDPFQGITGTEEEPDSPPFFLRRGLTPGDLLEMSVTEWKEMVNCPRRYYYGRVIGVPALGAGGEEPNPTGGKPGVLAPNERGTVVHRVFELLAESGGEPETWERFALQALEEQEIAPEDRKAALEEIRPFIGRFAFGEWYARVRNSSECRTEERFTFTTRGLTIIGVMDCLIRDARGNWEIIDYKTDQVTPETLEETAREYMPQLMLYALAASQRNIRPVRASLWFVGAGLERSWDVDATWIGRAEEMLEETAVKLRTSTEQDGWEPRPGKRCFHCPWNWLCDGAAAEG